MPLFFAGPAGAPVGRTVGFSDPHTLGTATFVELSTPGTNGRGLPFRWQTERAIITRVALHQSCNFQLMHTLGNELYVYVYGDRVGEARISGLAMANDCDNSGDPRHGFELVLAWYRRNRLARRRSPMTLTIGTTALQVLVAAVHGDVADPGLRLMQFDLSLVLLPEVR